VLKKPSLNHIIISSTAILIALVSPLATPTPLPDDESTILSLRFEGNLEGTQREVATASNEVSFEQGFYGQAIQFAYPGGYTRFPVPENIEPAEGTIEFWLKPNWDGDQDEKSHAFFSAGEAFNNGLIISIDGANNLRFLQWGDDPGTVPLETQVEIGLASSGAHLQAGTWYYLVATWKAGQEINLYLNGALIAHQNTAVVIEQFTNGNIGVGASVSGHPDSLAVADSTDGALDELRISDRMRTAEEIQTVYSDEYCHLQDCGDILFSNGFESEPFYDYWPNPVSQSNSDPWLVRNHDQIRVMRPRVLVLVFMNDWHDEVAKTEQLIESLRQSSRYHGYSNDEAQPFLEYEVVKYVDLRDLPDISTPDGNSTSYPRVTDWTDGNNFAYEQLYTEEFAEYFGFEDPDSPGTYLLLEQLVERGFINEVWFFAYHRDYGAPYETIENKQYYDQNLYKIPSAYGGAGNGHYADLPWTGRSLRFTFINGLRGIGCAMENFGHALEGMAHWNFAPYWREHFYEYAGFDLDTRWGLPFSSLYSCDQIDYPAPDHLDWSWSDQQGTVIDYYAVGGNVHFMPSGKQHYDLDNTQQVYSSIEHYRLFDGPGGEDQRDLWNRNRFMPYEALAPDCMGPWLVYWRMNMPGLDNGAIDMNGDPMKNWWVFLFY
jgi:hypothetical protein